MKTVVPSPSIITKITGPRIGIDSVPRLDVNYMGQQGRLEMGQEYLWGWGDPLLAYVHVRVQSNCLTLTYTNNFEVGQHQECVELDASGCYFGGTRLRFLCPGCQKSGYHLFLRLGRFRCKECNKMKYVPGKAANKDKEEMHGRHILQLPNVFPASPLVWFSSDIRLSPMECVIVPRPVQSIVLPIVPEEEAAQRRRKSEGRPMISIMDKPCTCGKGEETEGHRFTCPRGQLIYNRKRNNRPLV